MKILSIFAMILTLTTSAYAIEVIDENADPMANDGKRALIHVEKSSDEIICEQGEGCVTQKNKAKEDAAREYISEKKSKKDKTNNRQIKK